MLCGVIHVVLEGERFTEKAHATAANMGKPGADRETLRVVSVGQIVDLGSLVEGRRIRMGSDRDRDVQTDAGARLIEALGSRPRSAINGRELGQFADMLKQAP